MSSWSWEERGERDAPPQPVVSGTLDEDVEERDSVNDGEGEAEELRTTLA